jgi:hypothetical protein
MPLFSGGHIPPRVADVGALANGWSGKNRVSAVDRSIAFHLDIPTETVAAEGFVG